MTARIKNPHTIPEAVQALHELLPAKQLDTIRRSTRDDLVKFHFNLGSYIRNLWVHRDGSPLVERVRAAGGRIGDGDALSQLIIEALWTDLNDQNLELTNSMAFRSLLPSDDGLQQLASTLMSNE